MNNSNQPTLFPNGRRDPNSPAPNCDKTLKNCDIPAKKSASSPTIDDGGPADSTLKCHEMSPNVVFSQPFSLSRRQIRALPYIVSCPTLTEAARHSQVTLRTLQRWLRDQQFRDECRNDPTRKNRPSPEHKMGGIRNKAV